ncbi:SDR family oxidoreductase [soil metagenome]
MRLKNKTAIVTGAASGYGVGIATLFSREGANIVIADLDEAKGRDVARSIEAAGGKATFVRTNISKAEDVKGLLEGTLKAYGSLNIVVNNAATTHRRGPILDVEEEEFDRLFAINVKSLFLSAKTFVPYFRSVGGGVFVNVASITSFRPSPGLAWYNGTKAALVSISKSMALDFGKDRIRVNCVNPAVGDTGLLASFMGEPDTPQLRERYKSMIPLGRFTTPEDVGNACLYLASDDASFVTGTTIDVDGGRSI